jgi:pimeloyl-ACP methyl ester carboxylesterase
MLVESRWLLFSGVSNQFVEKRYNGRLEKIHRHPNRRPLSFYLEQIIAWAVYEFRCGVCMTNKINRLSSQSILQRVIRIMLALATFLLVCVVVLVGVLLAVSPGKPKPFLDENGLPLAGSISEKIQVNINGVEQGMFIKSRDKTRPVLLFLHGGPGMPEYAISREYPAVLEQDFIVCWWEQRGSGLSYNPGIPPETLTVDQLVSDTLAVTDYLRRRFGQDKIYLMGHSGGTFIGIQAAARAPQLYIAYLGMSQISRQLESEKLAYTNMLEQYSKAGDKKMVQRLEQIPLLEMDHMPPAYRALRDEAMHKIGIGTTHNMRSVVSGIFLPVMLNREYTLGEKINIWLGKWSAYSTNMWNQMLSTDLTAKVTKLDIPVYFFDGIYDYTVSYPLAKDYFDQLQAPLKGFYTFEQSAHSPLFEEPEKMRQIIEEDLLAGTNNLADIK